jgi:hypothetical protein
MRQIVRGCTTRSPQTDALASMLVLTFIEIATYGYLIQIALE